jgi:hypothetical protein
VPPDDVVVVSRRRLTELVRVVLALGLCLTSAEGRAVDGGSGVRTNPPLTASAARAAKEAARRDARAMYDAFHSGDLERFASYTDPGLLKAMGGKQKAIATIEEGRPKMAADGYRFESAEVGEVTQLVEAGAELQAMLPLNQVMTTPVGEVHLSGHVLGVSRDGGKTWTFIDAETLTPQNIQLVLPTYDPRLKLPGREKPKLIRK